MSGEIRRRELPVETHCFQDWLVECARRYASSESAPDLYSFDDAIEDWMVLHHCGLTPREALARMFGTLH